MEKINPRVDDEEREAYEEHLKWLRIETNTLKKYEAKGFAEGEQVGIVKGRMEGRMEGEQKLMQEKKSLARKLIKKGMNLETTSELTGLSCAEIESGE